jgi:transposase
MSSIAMHRTGRGRPLEASDPQVRRRYLTVAARNIIGGESARQLARAFDVSVCTIWYWIATACDFDDPRAQALRRRREQLERAAEDSPDDL